MKTSLAVMVCDIDGLKKINDSFGHLEGDKLLRSSAHALGRTGLHVVTITARTWAETSFVVTAPRTPPGSPR